MSKVSAFFDIPLKTVLKIRQLQKLLAFDELASILINDFYKSAMYLCAYIKRAVDSEDKREAVLSLRKAYMKLGAVRYYLEILKETNYLSESVTDGFSADFDEIERQIKPVIDEYEGEFEEADDDLCDSLYFYDDEDE